jgi:hypothetical protein
MTWVTLVRTLRLCNRNLLPGELRVEGQGLTERCGDRKIGLAIMFLSVIFLSACSSHVAEGCSRSSKVDYARFVEIATGSLFEAVSQATLGRNQGFLNQGEYQQVYDAAEKQSRRLSGWRKPVSPP